jgi:hypothetical protein
MTFEEFQQHCNQVASTNLPMQLPCPVVIGDGETHAYLGDTREHHLIIFKTATDGAALNSIYSKVRFSFDAPNNQTVIQPLTHGG